MNLSEYDYSGAVATLTVADPETHEPTDFKIELRCVEHAEARVAQRAAERKRLTRSLNSIPQASDEQALEIVGNEADESAVDALVACTVSWENCEFEGKKLECTPENAKMLYGRLIWLRRQVDRFVVSRRNFTKASAAS